MLYGLAHLEITRVFLQKNVVCYVNNLGPSLSSFAFFV